MLNVKIMRQIYLMRMNLKRNKKRNPLVRQLRNWYQRIVKSKKIYNRKKKYE